MAKKNTPSHQVAFPVNSIKTRFLQGIECSSPAFGTENGLDLQQLQAFLSSSKKVWQLVAEKFPYKPCRLVHHNHDLSKRWYIIFYAWNVATEQLERQRIFEPINRKKTIQSRLDVANGIMLQIDAELKAGKVLGRESLKKISETTKLQYDKLKVSVGIDEFMNDKVKAGRRKSYLRRFKTMKFHLREFYEHENIDEPLIKHIVKPDADFIDRYFDFIQPKMRSGKTFNNYRSDFATVLNHLNKKSGKKLFKDNPVSTVDTMRVAKKKHAAFNDDQVRAIIQKAQEKGYFQLVFFVRMMYYTLARSMEILKMRVRDIDIENNRIMFRGEQAKNWRDEYVDISPMLKDIIIQSGVLKADPEHYVFGRYGTIECSAGITPYTTDTAFYKRFMIVIRELKFDKINPNYSPYSIKHSGAISMYLATKDMQAVKRQCRHTSIKQTDDYLRDLGIIRTDQPVMKWQGAA